MLRPKILMFGRSPEDLISLKTLLTINSTNIAHGDPKGVKNIINCKTFQAPNNKPKVIRKNLRDQDN